MAHLYDSFLSALEERFPVKSELVGALVDLLHIEKESVYRRLRRVVYFSADEMMLIAGAWNISLDNITAAHPSKSHPFRFSAIDYAAPTDEDYAILERHNRDLEVVASDPDAVTVEIVNALPRGLYARSEPLTRFFTMKWRHKSSPDRALTFDEVVLSDRMRSIDRNYIRIDHSISEMHSIHDPRMFENVVGEIVYYRSIGMLTDDETRLLRDELAALVDYIERVAQSGHFPDSHNRMHFYLAHTWIETEYLLFSSRDLKLSMVKVLERGAITSLDGGVLDNFMRMARAAMRMSVLMSHSNVLQQAEYFARQRQIISAL